MFHVFLTECEDDKQLLDVHLDDGFSDQRSSKESPEGNQEMAAGDACQVKQGVGDLNDKIQMH